MPATSKTALVTGAAGFIGAALAERLLAMGYKVVGVDNLNTYYDPKLKRLRLKHLAGLKNANNFTFKKLDLANAAAVRKLMLAARPSVVLHMGAQAGVRYGLVNQQTYLESNLIGHFNILAACKALNEAKPGTLQHLLYASSSSVYGGNEKTPFSEADEVSRPQSLYASTKRADELITYAWCNQFVGSKGAFPATGLRFFTVYGPWGRPDMSPVMFANAILTGKPIQMFNKGDLWRDFTYIDDIVEAVIRLIPAAPKGKAPHEVYNLGNQTPVRMDAFVAALSKVLGKKPVLKMREWPPTEVYKTYASTAKLKKAVGWAPSTKLEDGLRRMADWYKPMHGKFKV